MQKVAYGMHIRDWSSAVCSSDHLGRITAIDAASVAAMPGVVAVYLDAGFVACRDVVLRWLEPDIAALPVGKVKKDAKTRLQEWLQGRSRPLPEYELIETRGDRKSVV